MIIPVRCVTCNKVLGDKWEYYKKKVIELEERLANGEISEIKKPGFTDVSRKEILDELNLKKICCRRHMLGHVDIGDVI